MLIAYSMKRTSIVTEHAHSHWKREEYVQSKQERRKKENALNEKIKIIITCSCLELHLKLKTVDPPPPTPKTNVTQDYFISKADLKELVDATWYGGTGGLALTMEPPKKRSMLPSIKKLCSWSFEDKEEKDTAQ